MLQGKSASPGIVVGTVLLIQDELPPIVRKPAHDVENQVTRLQAAVETARTQLQTIRDRALNEIGADKAAIFEAHLMMLEDPEFLGTAETRIREERIVAEAAFQAVSEEFALMFENMDDEYMKERCADVRDVSTRVLRLLVGQRVVDLATLDHDVVLVARDITPSQTATMNRKHVLGFLTDIGGKTSHSAIMARTLEIPAVLGLKTISSILRDGDTVAFDGETGEVIPNPSASILKDFALRRERFETTRRELKGLIGQESVTKDGQTVLLAANIGTPADIPLLKRNDAEAVGLYRTEFLFMDRDTAPTEDEQFESYKAVLAAMPNQSVVIRTLDIGGDKKVPYLKIAPEMNPFLGNRALRYCLLNPETFRTQLRALLRASVFGKLAIMFPLVSSLEEIREAKAILESVRAELLAEHQKISSAIEIGVMIEVPSAAIMADQIAKEVDFMSIGTNDLIQYTCAVDRMNESVGHLYDTYHPAVLRLVNQVVKAGREAEIWVGMCGEMAGTPDLIPVLVGMGLYEFSMSPASILRARRVVRSLNYSEAQKLATRVLNLSTSAEIRGLLQ
jgi:phosphotransferase system enzyme I (PtsI)